MQEEDNGEGERGPTDSSKGDWELGIFTNPSTYENTIRKFIT